MGTDIHPAVEVRRNGVWRYHRPKEPCRWYNEVWSVAEAARINANTEYVTKYGPVVVGSRRNTWDRCKTRLPEFFSERNYRAFAVLGDVRNGSGFAGVYTHDPIDPISSERGWPEGMAHETRAKMSNEHSETWVSLAELQAYDYNQMIQEGGVLDEQEYQRCALEGDDPKNWSGGISGQNIVIVTPGEYALMFDSPIELLQSDWRKNASYDKTKRYFISHRWQRKLRDEVKAIPDEMIPYLERLVPKGGTPEDVRLVFDFDS